MVKNRLPSSPSKQPGPGLPVRLLTAALAGGFTALVVLVAAARGAPSGTAPVYEAQRIDAQDLGLFHLLGLAYSPYGRIFQVVGTAGPGLEDAYPFYVVRTNAFWDPLGERTVSAICLDASNTVYIQGTLYALDCLKQRLVPLGGVPGNPGTGQQRFVQSVDLSALDLADPRGIAYDPYHRQLFILEAAGPAIIRLQADRRNAFAAQSAHLERRVTGSLLALPTSADLRGLAFHPFDHNLYTLDMHSTAVLRLDFDGTILWTVDAGSIFFRDPRAIVFAPSSDSTDAPNKVNLFVSDSGIGLDAVLPGQIVEIVFGD